MACCMLQYIWICVVPDMVMSLGGDSSPCARCEIVSIGNLGEKENVFISKALCSVFSRNLILGGKVVATGGNIVVNR